MKRSMIAMVSVMAVVAVMLALTGTAGAAVVYTTHLASNDTSPAAYGPGVAYWPTPHMDPNNYTVPPKTTVFGQTDVIWVAVELAIQQLASPDDDIDLNGYIDWTADFYNPSGTLVHTDTTGTGYTWATIMAWKAAGYNHLDLWTGNADNPSESLKDFFGGTLAVGTWTVKTYLEGGNLNQGQFDVTPEPATMALLAAGGIGMLLRRKRSK
jgi:hypothetical protein